MRGARGLGSAPGEEVRISVLGALPEIVPGDDLPAMLAAVAADAGAFTAAGAPLPARSPEPPLPLPHTMNTPTTTRARMSPAAMNPGQSLRDGPLVDV